MGGYQAVLDKITELNPDDRKARIKLSMVAGLKNNKEFLRILDSELFTEEERDLILFNLNSPGEFREAFLKDKGYRLEKRRYADGDYVVKDE
jgi:hypothetical protein